MIKTNVWHNDVCGCVIEYEFDDSEPPTIRTHKPARVIKQCPTHAGIKTITELWSATIEQNQRRMNALTKLSELLGKTPQKVFADWSWKYEGSDNNMILHISHPELTKEQKTLLKNMIDKEMGLRKVAVE